MTKSSILQTLCKKVGLVMFGIAIHICGVNAQNSVGIGTATPNQNTVLELVSPNGNQGFLLPRLTTAQRTVTSFTSSLSSNENGMIVYDSDLSQFFYWLDTQWVAGLGAFSDQAGGDLQGTYPNPIIRIDAIDSDKILDGSILGADISNSSVGISKIDGQGNTSSVLTTDVSGNPQWIPQTTFTTTSLTNGEVLIGDISNTAQSRPISGDISLAGDGTVAILPSAIGSVEIADETLTSNDIGADAIGSSEISTGAVASDEILDGSIVEADLSNNSVTSNKIDAQGNTDVILGADGSGIAQWIPQADFVSSNLPNTQIYIGDNLNSAQAQTVQGDMSLANDGTATITDNAITGNKIADDAITTADIAPGAVTTDDIASGGTNKVLVTTTGGTVFWENISLFETSNLPEGNIFLGDVSNNAAPLNAKGNGRILVGDGTTLNSLNVSGDITMNNLGQVQINANTITDTELADNAVDNLAIQDQAINTAKLSDNAVTGIKIQDGTIDNAELADDAVDTQKIDGEGNNNALLTTDGSGNPQWVPQTNYIDSSLPSGQVFVGDNLNTAQSQAITGDISLSNNGDAQLNTNVVGTNEVIDNSITLDDIGPNAIAASELADNSVDAGAIQNDVVSSAKIDSEGNNDAVLTTDGSGNPQWESKTALNDADADPTNEIQDLSIAGNTLSLSGDASPVDLSGYLDNTDVQDLSLTGNTLNLTNDGSSVDLSGYLDNTDNQNLTNVLGQGNTAGGASITNVADPTNAQDVATKNYVDTQSVNDADADPTNEIQDLSIAGNTLSLSGDASPVDLSSYLDDTDAQDLSLTGNTLSLTNDGTSVDLSGYLDNTDSQNLNNVLGQGNTAGGASITNVADPTNAQDVATKNYVDSQSSQDLSIAGNTLSLSGDASPVDLSGYLDNTDNQNLTNVLGQGNTAGGASITNVADPTNAQDVATKNYVDSQSSQDLSIAGNTLSLSGDATPVDLSGYLDDTDAQDLSLAGNTLSLTNDGTSVDLSGYLDNTDSQNLSNVLGQGNTAGGSSITNVADPTNAQDVATKNYVDSQSSQDLSIAGNTLSLSGDASPVDLSGYLDNTDNQNLTNVLGQGNTAGGASITNVADPTNAQDVATKNYVDSQSSQDLSIAGNTLSLSGDATPVDLSGYLDDTDAQDLSLAGNTLSLTNDGTSVDLSGYLDNTDSQNLSNVLGQGNTAGGSSITNVADPTNAQDVATKNYVDTQSVNDADADPTNEIQDLSIAGNTLSLSGDASPVDLSGYLDDTDAQDLSLAGNTLSLTNDGTSVDLSGYLDNTDSQNLSNVLGQGNTAGGSSITNVADPTNAQDVATKNYVDTQSVNDADADPNNELQTISKAGSTVTLSNGGGSFTDEVDDADPNASNELQTVSKVGSTVTLSNGGGSFTDEVDDADANASNELQTVSKVGSTVTLSNGGGSFTDEVDDADANASNELQTVSKVGSTVTLSNGGGSFTDEVDDADANASNELQTISKVGSTVTLSNGGGTFTDAVDDADADASNEIQSLSILGSDLSISGGNTVTIPGGAPSGAAGGDLTGTYPNPSIANNAIAGGEIQDAAVTATKLSQSSAADGQVLKWNQTLGQWVASNDLTTVAGAITGYYGIDATAFWANDANGFGVATNSEGTEITTNDDGDIIAPINLPDGAVISDVIAYFHDNSGGDDLTFYVYRQAYGGTTVETIATATSSGNPGDTNLTLTISAPLATVDNSLYTYKMRVTMFWANPTPRHKMYGARITYTK